MDTQKISECPPPDRLRGLLSGELAVGDQDAVTQHIETCPACQRTLDGWLSSPSVEGLAAAGKDSATQEAALRDLMDHVKKKSVGDMTQAEPSDDAAGDLSYLKPNEKPNTLGRLNHYDVLQVLGKGGFGTVFKALDTKLQRMVAIKVLAPELAANGSARKRFIREAQAAAAIKNEHVVAIYNVEDEHQPPYIVMEIIDGISLQDRIDKAGSLELKEILRIGMQIAEGLAAAHKQGLIHRDIKPANILLENGVQRVKITDFGLARLADDASITQSGVIAGTPMYMAPEQAQGEQLDHRADLFSLGSVLYSLCAGHPPFRANTVVAVLKRVCEERPRPIREVNPELPDWLGEIITKLHAKDARDRYQTAREVADVLGEKLAELQFTGRASNGRAGSASDRSEPAATIAPTPVAHVPGSPKRVILGMATVSVLALIAVLAAVFWLRSAGEVAPPEKRDLVENKKPPVVPVAKPDNDGWVQLFNGKDLAGWSPHPTYPGSWAVENGNLVGSKKRGYLLTKAGGFENFHFRAEVKMEEAGDAGVLFHVPADWQSQEADCLPSSGFSTHVWSTHKGGPFTGSLVAFPFKWLAPSTSPPVKLGEWIVLEVVVDDGHARTLVNGQPIALKTRLPSKQDAYLALNTFTDNTAVRFKKIEIKVLPASKTETPPLALAPFDAEKAKDHQDAWAKHLGVPVEYTNSLGMKFRLIPPGEFLMGSTPAEIAPLLVDAGPWLRAFLLSESPQHKVILTKPFYLGVNEVTQAEYQQVMGQNPAHYSAAGNGKAAVVGMDTSIHPVETVSWNDAAEFCAKLSADERLSPFYSRKGDIVTILEGFGYRLPTEAQWEFACRAGTTTKFWMGDKAEGQVQHSWPLTKMSRTHAVGELKANPFGLFDVHGNVWEWTQDWWDPNYYAQFQEKPARDPCAPQMGSGEHVVRGGGWWGPISDCRASVRRKEATWARHNTVGFRAALTVEAVKQLLKDRITRPPLAVAPFDAKKAKEYQDAWAKHLGLDPEFKNSIGMKFRVIPPGRFAMGSSKEQIDVLQLERSEFWRQSFLAEGPQHDVTISSPFCLGVHSVTVGQFKQFAKEKDYQTEAEKGGGIEHVTPKGRITDPLSNWLKPGFDQADDHPVVGITWNDAKAFCDWLSTKEGKTYALPTEAQWEYACRAGTKSAYSFGDDSTQLGQFAWFLGNSGWKTHAVGAKRPNPWGLHDTHGNARNWTADWFSKDHYKTAAADNPTGPTFGVERVMRGGAWAAVESTCRSATRSRWAPNGAFSDVGFRVAIVGELKAKAPVANAGPFLLLPREGKGERKFATLSDAVAAAKSGDTIEIQGNGPFETEPLSPKNQSLAIRAGAGFRPVVRLNASGAQSGAPLIKTNGPLVLEGLELHRTGDIKPRIIQTWGPLQVANCRFVNQSSKKVFVRLIETYGADLDVSNCEFLESDGSGRGVALQSRPEYRSAIRNSVFTCKGVELCFVEPGGVMLLENNTFQKHGPVSLNVLKMPEPGAWNGKKNLVSVTLKANIYQRRIDFVYPADVLMPPSKDLTADEMAALLPRIIGWVEAKNLHHMPITGRFLEVRSPKTAGLVPAGNYRTLADWMTFWRQQTNDALEGEVRFHGGDLFAKKGIDLRLVSPADFRLVKGSPGQGVLPGGKDLGADVDLVGPGPAYERWKQTPGYQEWRKQTEALMSQ